MRINAVFGSIIGDIIGSAYEFNGTKNYDFDLYNPKAHITDDTVHTIAIAQSILSSDDNYGKYIRFYMGQYPKLNYGPLTINWFLNDESGNSYGNGSAMRVSPIGSYFNAINDVLVQSKKSAIVTHTHPEGIKGAQAIATSIFLAKAGNSKEEIKTFVESNFQYDLNFSINEIRPHYRFFPICQETVPQAIVSFLESTDYESTIRNAISLGGDADTLACMAGGIAAAFYNDIPQAIVDFAKTKLSDDFIDIINQF
ncbi:ADP-ribosylglycohydrolase family protein [Flavobacteriaceae bacterium]|nr:ADP-ribosylglycohydrolase family protein [Flavobacteriaceae bacterium]